jgi:hypothetical protein
MKQVKLSDPSIADRSGDALRRWLHMPKRTRELNPFLSGTLDPKTRNSSASGIDGADFVSWESIDHLLIIFSDEIGQQTRHISGNCARSVDVLVKHLADCVQRKELRRNSVAVSSLSDATLLLLPWAMQMAITHNARTSLVFRTLAASLDYLQLQHHDPFCESQRLRILTQGAIFKLIQVVAKCAMDSPTDWSDDHPNMPRKKRPSTLASEDVMCDEECESLISSTEDLGRHACRVFSLLLPLYTPTLDVACKGVLLPVIHSLDLQNTFLKRHTLGEAATEFDDERSVVLVRVLDWLSNLLSSPGVNHKTTFSLFATPSIMLAFVRCYIYFDQDDRPGSMMCDKTMTAVNSRQEVVVGLLNGLFDQRHLDGFRSLLLSRRPREDPTGVDQSESAIANNKAPFRSYQEELFSGLTAALNLELCFDDDPAADDRQKRGIEVHDMTKVVPILLDGFMSKAEKWYQQLVDMGNRPAEKRARSNSYAWFQFQMFERLTQPLLPLMISEASRVDQNCTTLASLASLSACLQILLKYNGYRPSHDESDISQFRLLERMTLKLLTFIANDRHFDGVQQLGCVLVGLRWLFKLDHRLLLPRLSDVLVMCSACRDVRLSAPVNSLLLSVVDTYGLLRQQSALFESLARSSADQVLLSHFSVSTVAQAMAESIESCTTLQATKLLDLIKVCLNEVCDVGESEYDSKLTMIGYLCGLLTSHLPLDISGASGIAIECRSFLEGPVSRLLALGQRIRGSIGSQVTLSSISLCGMFLELQGRCAFLESLNLPVAIPLPFMELMNVMTEQAIPDSVHDFGGEMDLLADGWMPLWCHRLRVIHSIVQRKDGARDHGENLGADTLLTEAKALVYLTTEAACQQTHVQGGGLSRWVVISTNLSVWLSYATDAQVNMFLNWLFTLVTLDPISPLVPPTSGLGSRLDFSETEGELGFAMRLFHDTTFLSHQKIKKWLHLSAISSSAEWVAWALSEVESDDDRGWIKLHDLVQSSPQDVHNWTNLGAEDLSRIAVEITPLRWPSTKMVSTVLSRLQRASRPLKIVNGLASLVDDVRSSRIFIDVAFRLVHVIGSLAKSKRRLLGEGMDFIGVLRHSISSAMLPFSSHNFLALKQLLSIHVGTTTSALSMYQKCEIGDECDSMSIGFKAFMVGTKSLVQQLTSLILLCDDSGIAVLSTVRALVEHEDAFEGNIPSFLLGLGRSIVEALPKTYSQRREALLVRDELWEYIVALLEVGPEPEPEVFGDVCLILGVMIRIFGDWNTGSWPRKETLIKIADQAMVVLESGVSTSDAFKRGCRYLVACASATSPKPQHFHVILSALLTLPVGEDSFLEASFCHFAGNLSLQAAGDCLKILLGQNVNSVSSGISRVRLLRLFLQCINRAEQTETLATHGPQLLHFALSFMNVDTTDERTYAAIEACHVTRYLIRSHEVLPLRDRDLARILSHLSSMLGPSKDTSRETKAIVLEIRWLSTDLFLECSQVVLSMFQRYTKHLYSCVPSVISVLHSFMGRILYDTGDVSDEDIARRGQAFSRLSELLVPHGDIYKKHLIGLLLEFVHSLEGKLSTLRKELLLPAVYYMLDCLSLHETRQLNVLMSTMGKALFQGVYQSYQKVHAYKGQ